MPRYIALVPAAGSGSRFGDTRPKQYCELAGRPLLEHTLRGLAASSAIDRVLVVLAPGDEHFRSVGLDIAGARIDPLYCGGETRAASVYNGLVAARSDVEADDWILVHDAARPCLQQSTVDRLIGELSADALGGLLALPVADTLKRADAEGRVESTEPRERMWQAQTPQMFRYALLVEALRRAGPHSVTDEAGAIERMGLRPRLIRGEPTNIKVTHAADLDLATTILMRNRK